jgi:predicted component of type VI protein secretion system
MPNLLKVRLSLKGRPIRSYTFNKKEVTIGRDPGSDIFLDNAGISRQHARIERTPGGYVLEDLGSANGTFLNESQISRDFVGHDDVVQIGKFALWVGVESDRRERSLLQKSANPGVFEGTTVLDPDSLMQMQKKARSDAPEETPAPPRPAPKSPPKSSSSISGVTYLTSVGAAFVLGTFLGIAAVLFFRG